MGEWRQEDVKRWERDLPGFSPVRTRFHRAAFVERGAAIHETAEIGPGSVIGPHVRIGPRVKIGAHAVLIGHTELEADVTVHAGAVIGDEPQDNGFRGGQSRVRVGPRTRIREYVMIHGGNHLLATRTAPLERCLDELRGRVTTALGREYLEFLSNPSKRGIMPFEARA